MAPDDPDRHLVELALECLRNARPEPMTPEATSDDTQGKEPASDDTRSDHAG
jgi:hypothetical protein